MSRKQSREFAMKLIYQMELQREDREEQLEYALEESEVPFTAGDLDYIRNVIDGVFSNVQTLDSTVEQNAKGWKLQRISRVDLSILRLCIYEIRFRDDIPLNVSINEAVELAKKFGSEDSGSFINGILSNVKSPDPSATTS